MNIFIKIPNILAGLLAATLLGILALLAFAPRTSAGGSGYGQGYGQRGGYDYDYSSYDDFGYKARSGTELVDGEYFLSFP